MVHKHAHYKLWMTHPYLKFLYLFEEKVRWVDSTTHVRGKAKWGREGEYIDFCQRA